MGERIFRIFVGNLPPDAVEGDLESLMKTYGTVVSVEIKRRTDGHFAYINLKDLKTDLNACFQKLSLKKWKGNQLRVQMARESFLERLARERLENQNASMNIENAADSKNNVNNSSERKELVIHSDSETTNDNILKENGNDSDVSSYSSDCSSDSNDSETPVKGGLRMFRGTKEMEEKKEEESWSPETSKHATSKISTGKIHEEREILEKFEMFNSVWKDEDSDIPLENGKSEPEREKKHEERRLSSNSNLEVNSNKPLSLDMLDKIKREAEKRRIKALQNRKQELLKRKSIVQYALASVDSTGNVSRPNKKIKFTDDGMQEEESGKFSSHTGEQKLILFSEDEMENEMNNKDDFRIRDHYEGKKGKSLLELQARYGNDKRFTLDERFVESEDSDQEDVDKIENNDPQAERQQVFRILGNVLGKELSGPGKTKPKLKKMMLRYDPTKPDHTKFEIKEAPSSQKIKKKKTVKSDHVDEVPKSKEISDTLPVVSKERYYQVSETLHEALQNQNQTFNLQEMFDNNESEDEDDEEKDAEVNLAEKPIVKKKEWSLNPFKNDSSSSEDEDFEQNIKDQHLDQNKVGVKQENLFFDTNDARFIEGIEFIKFQNREYIEEFEEMRPKIKQLIFKKVRNHQLKAELGWKRKQFGKQIKR